MTNTKKQNRILENRVNFSKTLGFTGVVAILILAILVIAGCANTQQSQAQSQQASQQSTTQTQPTAAQSQPQQNQVKLSDTQYSNYAYLISGDTIDPQAQAALAGFQVEKVNNSDGSMNITLKALEPRYTDQSYVVPAGDKLYFIEGSMGDDSGISGEYSLGDDACVLIDANGYILQQGRS